MSERLVHRESKTKLLVISFVSQSCYTLCCLYKKFNGETIAIAHTCAFILFYKVKQNKNLYTKMGKKDLCKHGKEGKKEVVKAREDEDGA